MYFNSEHKGSVNETRNHHSAVIRTKEQLSWNMNGTKRADDAQAEILTSSFAAFRSTSNGFYRSGN